MSEKFIFPNAGIHIVSQKIGEADYFLMKLKETHSWDDEFNYIFSAYVSALRRSITFTLQFVMKKYPGFDEWYTSRQEKLRNSLLAKSFVEFRNHAQKTGIIPIAKERSFFEGIFYKSDQFYVPTNSEIKSVPEGNATELSEKCLIEVLEVVAACYKDFDIYIDPRVLFTERGIKGMACSSFIYDTTRNGKIDQYETKSLPIPIKDWYIQSLTTILVIEQEEPYEGRLSRAVL